jgi:hypothetical protein
MARKPTRESRRNGTAGGLIRRNLCGKPLDIFSRESQAPVRILGDPGTTQCQLELLRVTLPHQPAGCWMPYTAPSPPAPKRGGS